MLGLSVACHGLEVAGRRLELAVELGLVDVLVVDDGLVEALEGGVEVAEVGAGVDKGGLLLAAVRQALLDGRLVQARAGVRVGLKAEKSRAQPELGGGDSGGLWVTCSCWEGE